MKKYYLGFDFGASSGRAILGILDIDEATGKKNLEIEEVYRFPNEAVREGNVLRWETERLFNEMKTGITLVAEKGIHIESIGIDTWGVDFGIIDENGNIVFRPVSYRHDGRSVQKDGKDRDFRKHRPCIPAVQHALSADCHENGSRDGKVY